MIISTRFDINGIANQDELIYSGEYLHFLESLDKPGYYLIIKGGVDDTHDYEMLNSKSLEVQIGSYKFYFECRAKTSKSSISRMF